MFTRKASTAVQFYLWASREHDILLKLSSITCKQTCSKIQFKIDLSYFKIINSIFPFFCTCSFLPLSETVIMTRIQSYVWIIKFNSIKKQIYHQAYSLIASSLIQFHPRSASTLLNSRTSLGHKPLRNSQNTLWKRLLWFVWEEFNSRIGHSTS